LVSELETLGREVAVALLVGWLRGVPPSAFLVRICVRSHMGCLPFLVENVIGLCLERPGTVPLIQFVVEVSVAGIVLDGPGSFGGYSGGDVIETEGSELLSPIWSTDTLGSSTESGGDAISVSATQSARFVF
jgi:hypothetical protein